MSRTKKDKPDKLLFPDHYEYDKVKASAKKPKRQDTSWHWLQSTPSWWTNLFMNRPLRREAQQWEREVQKIKDLEELEEVDKPNVSKKPHHYYY